MKATNITTGVWIDYREDGTQGSSLATQTNYIINLLAAEMKILVTEKTAQIISNTVAVLLTLTLPRLVTVITHIEPIILSWFRRPTRTQLLQNTEPANSMPISDGTTSETHELQQLSPIKTFARTIRDSRLVSNIGQAFEGSTTLEHAGTNLIRRAAMPHIKLNPDEELAHDFLPQIVHNFREDATVVLLLFLGASLLYALFIGTQIFVVLSNGGIIKDGYGLSNSPGCAYPISKTLD